MVKQTYEDLSKKLDLIPINKKFESSLPQLTFTPEEGEEEKSKENIKLIIDKGSGVTSKGLGGLPRKYVPFQDKIFGIWYDSDRFYIGNESNDVMIEGDDLIINNKKYKGTHGLWKILTNPNRKKLDKETYNKWWTNKDNFTENDLNTYKEILKKTYSIYQNNDPSSKVSKSNACWNSNNVFSTWYWYKKIKKQIYFIFFIKRKHQPAYTKFIFLLWI